MCTLYVGRFISSTSDLLNSVEDYINIVFLDKICSLIYYLNGLIFSDKKINLQGKANTLYISKTLLHPILIFVKYRISTFFYYQSTCKPLNDT